MADIVKLENQQMQRIERRLYGIETALKELTAVIEKMWTAESGGYVKESSDGPS